MWHLYDCLCQTYYSDMSSLLWGRYCYIVFAKDACSPRQVKYFKMLDVFCIIVLEHILFVFVLYYCSRTYSLFLCFYFTRFRIFECFRLFRFLALKLVIEMPNNHFIIVDLLVYLSYFT